MVKVIDYQLIADEHYKLGIDEILRRCILKHERDEIMRDAHEGMMRGHYAGNVAPHKIMHVGIWWPTIFKDTKEYCESFDVS